MRGLGFVLAPARGGSWHPASGSTELPPPRPAGGARAAHVPEAGIGS